MGPAGVFPIYTLIYLIVFTYVFNLQQEQRHSGGQQRPDALALGLGDLGTGGGPEGSRLGALVPAAGHGAQ